MAALFHRHGHVLNLVQCLLFARDCWRQVRRLDDLKLKKHLTAFKVTQRDGFFFLWLIDFKGLQLVITQQVFFFQSQSEADCDFKSAADYLIARRRKKNCRVIFKCA